MLYTALLFTSKVLNKVKYKKFTVNVPLCHAELVREAIAKAGGGKIGEYTHCSFSIRGIGRCKPLQNSNPNYGERESFSSEEEEKIESFCLKENLEGIIEAIKNAHPYEEPAISAWDVEIF